MVSCPASVRFHQLRQQLGSDLEARELFYYCTKLRPHDLLRCGSKELPQSQLKQLEQLVARRLQGEPLQYLLGEWEFFGLPFFVGPGVLIPRPETELLVENATAWLKNKTTPANILELCAGTGCISITLEQLTASTVTAVELSSDAFAYLINNIALHHSTVQPVQANLFDWSPPQQQRYDLIVANPPYIPTEDLASLQTEVQQEPSLALDGGADGLLFYRFITEHYRDFLADNGRLAFEIGIGQLEPVTELFRQQHYHSIGFLPDLAGIPRIVWGHC